MRNTTLSVPDIRHIPMRLDHLRHLYKATDYDPFTTQMDYLSGIEQIDDELLFIRRE